MADGQWVFIGDAIDLLIKSGRKDLNDSQKARTALLLELYAGTIPARAASFLSLKSLGSHELRRNTLSDFDIPAHFWWPDFAKTEAGSFDQEDRTASWDWAQSHFLRKFKMKDEELGLPVNLLEEMTAVKVREDVLRSSLSLLKREGAQLPNSQAGKSRGRPKGSGRYDDTQIVQKMDRLIKSGQAASPNDAAIMLRDQLHGRGDPASRVRRVCRNYKAYFGEQIG